MNVSCGLGKVLEADANPYIYEYFFPESEPDLFGLCLCCVHHFVWHMGHGPQTLLTCNDFGIMTAP